MDGAAEERTFAALATKRGNTMRRVSPLVAVVAIVSIVLVFGQSGPSSSARQDEIPPPRALLVSPSTPTFLYQGVASCASVACHHGNGPSGTKGSEYTTWIAQGDPHSRAYTVLFDRRSLLIEKNLKGLSDLKKAQPHKDTLCLSCHVNPDVETADHHERFSRADGVGCESCHGAAEKWLSVHYTAAWQSLSTQEKQKAGMIDTKNIEVRAQVCVRCHVGWQDADVNHDLIAAGHPRLRFEYGAYLANYPARHWKVDDDHARYGDFEARAWLLGQTASAKAALDLLAYRADAKHGKPWPEFAEYGCFGCHHDLSDQQWRQKRGAGQLPWGTWYFSLRSVVAEQLRPARGDDLKAFDRFEELMARHSPNRAQVSREAATLSQTLERWSASIGRERREEKSLRGLLAALVEGGEKGDPEWDRAAQRYLGIAAAYNAVGDINGRFRGDGELKSTVLRLAASLGRAFPKDRGVQYDSPRDFEPDQLQRDLQRLREALRRRDMP